MQYVTLAAADVDGGVGFKEAIFAALLFCCAAVFAVEIVKKMQPEVTIEKLVALGIAVCVLVVAVVVGCVEDVPPRKLVTGLGQLLMMLAVSLGLIWFDDVLGDLVGIRSGLVSKASPGFLIRLMGWVFLLGMIGLPIYFACQ